KADTQSASAARQPTLPVAPAVPAEEESLPLADESSADLRQGGAQLSEALLADLFPAGDAAIWGEVRTADGEPLPGVKISARRMSKPQFEERLAGWNRQHADQLDTLDEAERDRISGLAMRMWADDGEFSAVTGADG